MIREALKTEMNVMILPPTWWQLSYWPKSWENAHVVYKGKVPISRVFLLPLYRFIVRELSLGWNKRLCEADVSRYSGVIGDWLEKELRWRLWGCSGQDDGRKIPVVTCVALDSVCVVLVLTDGLAVSD